MCVRDQPLGSIGYITRLHTQRVSFVHSQSGGEESLRKQGFQADYISYLLIIRCASARIASLSSHDPCRSLEIFIILLPFLDFLRRRCNKVAKNGVDFFFFCYGDLSALQPTDVLH